MLLFKVYIPTCPYNYLGIIKLNSLLIVANKWLCANSNKHVLFSFSFLIRIFILFRLLYIAFRLLSTYLFALLSPYFGFPIICFTCQLITLSIYNPPLLRTFYFRVSFGWIGNFAICRIASCCLAFVASPLCLHLIFVPKSPTFPIWLDFILIIKWPTLLIEKIFTPFSGRGLELTISVTTWRININNRWYYYLSIICVL